MNVKKQKSIQKMLALCLSVSIAAVSILPGRVFAGEESEPASEYLMGQELLDELRGLGLGQLPVEVPGEEIPPEEVPEASIPEESSSETSESSGEETSSEPSEPSGGETSSETSEPSEGETSSEPSEPSEGETSSEPSEPSEGETSSEPSEPSEGETSSEPSEEEPSSKPTEPSEEDKPLVSATLSIFGGFFEEIESEVPSESAEPSEDQEETVSSEPESSAPVESSDEAVSSEPSESSEPEESSVESSLPEESEIDPGFGVDPIDPGFGVEIPDEEVPQVPAREVLVAYVQTLEAEQIVSLEETNITIEEYTDLYSMLTSDQLKDVFDYQYPTVTFTDAGPILYTTEVDVTPNRAMAMMAAPYEEKENGLILDKNAVANGDGTYTITLEAYTTGTVKTETSTTPVDVVLVLDQSGSMAYGFDGKGASYENSRQYAMKQAVNSFIQQTYEKFDSTNADHRISIVTFGSEAKTLAGWTFANEVDEDGNNKLQGIINKLPQNPSGATNVAAGMKEAQSLINNSSYSGTNSERSQVVIVFTDGVPTEHSDFDIGVANGAISAAKDIKSKATVYTVGIFNGADPNQLHGPTYHYLDWGFKSRPCTGEEGEIWNTDVKGWWSNEIKEQDIPAGNRFLNYLSSNFEDATQIGITNREDTILGIGYFGYQITQNFNRDSDQYYLTASDSESLKNIFQEISDEIGTPNIPLDDTTEVRDIISDYFTLPVGVTESDIKVYTETYNYTEKVWGGREESDLEAIISGDTVSVSGFDFNAHYLNDKEGATGPAPEVDSTQKLIMEFNVQPKDGFLGGNNVPTNENTSGVYNDEAGGLVEAFEEPKVDVPIKDVTVTAQDKNVYLLGDLTADQLKDGATVKVGDVSLNLDPEANNYGLESWQNEFVNITVTAPADLKDLEVDTTYTISAEVAPKSTSTKPNAATAKTGTSEPANINVFKPEITWKDSAIDAGQTPNYDNVKNTDIACNFVKAEWKHEKVEYDSRKMIGQEPTLTYSYDPEAKSIDTETKVNVTVKILNQDVTEFVNFLHEECTFEGGCSFKPEECEFIVHIKSFDLTVTKQVSNGKNNTDSFLFTVDGEGFHTQFTLKAGESLTIKGLNVGTYKVTEDQSWSWEYDVSDGDTQIVTSKDVVNGKATVIFNNTKDKEKWLSWEGTEENNFKPVA